MVHFEANKHNISGIDRSEMTSARKLLISHGYLIVPILILLYFLVIERASVNASAFYSIIAMIIIAFFAYRFKTSMGRTIIFAAILLAITFSMQYLIGFVNGGLIIVNDTLALIYSMQKQYAGEVRYLQWYSEELLRHSFSHSFRKLAKRDEPRNHGLNSTKDSIKHPEMPLIYCCLCNSGILIRVITTSGLSTKFTKIVIDFSDTIEGWLRTCDTQYSALYRQFSYSICMFAARYGASHYSNIPVRFCCRYRACVDEHGAACYRSSSIVLYYGVLADDTPP